jgi:hypothetical protein
MFQNPPHSSIGVHNPQTAVRGGDCVVGANQLADTRRIQIRYTRQIEDNGSIAATERLTDPAMELFAHLRAKRAVNVNDASFLREYFVEREHALRWSNIWATLRVPGSTRQLLTWTVWTGDAGSSAPTNRHLMPAIRHDSTVASTD